MDPSWYLTSQASSHTVSVQLCNEWLLQELQGEVSQLKLLFIIVAVVSLRAIFSMYYVCGKYITILNALFITPY